MSADGYYQAQKNLRDASHSLLQMIFAEMGADPAVQNNIRSNCLDTARYRKNVHEWHVGKKFQKKLHVFVIKEFFSDFLFFKLKLLESSSFDNLATIQKTFMAHRVMTFFSKA